MTIPIRPYTVEEFEHFVDLPENADRLFELIGGEIVEVPSNPYSSEIAANIVFFIKLYLYQHKRDDHVTTEGGGYMVAGERYAPDVAVLAKAKQAVLAKKGYNPLAPDLAVEVMSPTDTDESVRIKLTNYLLAGTTVWIVNSKKKNVEVYVPGQSPKIIPTDSTLDGGTVLPGFTLPVKDIFPA